MNTGSLAEAMCETLRNGENLLEQLSDAEYCEPCPLVFHGSVGNHYRHVLDHFRNLLEVSPNAILDYDHRLRQTPVEIQRSAALAESGRIRGLIGSLNATWDLRPVQISTRVSATYHEIETVNSTAGREAVFCILHAVHHYALIRVICGFMGKIPPAEFGVAPSTLAAGSS
jgi:hypothetical protein